MSARRRTVATALVLFVLFALFAIRHGSRTPDTFRRPPGKSWHDVQAGMAPSDWFLRQRAWPQEDIDQSARLAAHRQARALRALDRTGPAWQPVGPTNISGRLADLACHPTDANIVYAGAASGGVWKTTDRGASWVPLFDDESSLSIGSLAIDPSNPEVVYVGTGEPNGGGGSVTYGGTGVFKTTNGGATWTNVGLADTRYIGRVVVDPSNSNNVFVAAAGAMWSTGPDRGVYRSTDAGQTWEKILYLATDVGAIDLVIDPSDPQRVFAATWERTRGPNFYTYGGDGSGLWRSTNGGSTWTELTSGLPSGPTVGRIGLAIAESQPSTLYAIYAEASPGYFEGVYKTTNGGDSWTPTNDAALSNVYASYGWWFGNIRVDPANPNRVFVLGLDFYRSTTGGSSWGDAHGTMHVDHHALDWAADGSIWEGNDGGVYRSVNGGTVWTEFENLPITQFYTVEVDDQFPERRYGGTQDNGTNRTLTGAIDDWANIYWGDGFYCQVDPNNNQYVYAEYQYGGLGRSTDGGLSFDYGGNGLSGRANWSMPYQMDPSLPTRLYAGTDRVYRSTNRAASWSVISSDLTDGDGGIGGYTFGTLTTLAVAPSNPDAILAGTDDANVWITTNGGSTWTPLNATLPERWVTRVAFDPHDDSICYVTVSGFRWDEYQPHVFRSTNHGGTWTDISANLPVAPVNDIVVDPQSSNVLYVGTDFGVYRSTDTGGSWETAGNGLPNVVVNDLELHDASRTLVAGTYGRSQWTLDVSLGVGVDEVAAVDAASLRAPSLLPPFPNPSRDADVTVRWAQPREASVRIDVFDVAGRRIANLVGGNRVAGDHAVTWDGRDEGGTRVAAGVYVVRLAGDGVVRTRRVTRVR